MHFLIIVNAIVCTASCTVHVVHVYEMQKRARSAAECCGWGVHALHRGYNLQVLRLGKRELGTSARDGGRIDPHESMQRVEAVVARWRQSILDLGDRGGGRAIGVRAARRGRTAVAVPAKGWDGVEVPYRTLARAGSESPSGIGNGSCSAGCRACKYGGQWQRAPALFSGMWKEEFVPEVISYSVEIRACR